MSRAKRIMVQGTMSEMCIRDRAVYQGCYSFAEGGIAPYTPQC